MFEKFVDRRDRRRPRWVVLAIATSALLHLSLVAGLVLSALWQLEKLSAEQRPVYYRATVGPPMVAMSSSKPPPKANKPRPPRARRDLTQPSRATQDQGEDQSLTLSDEEPGYGVPDGVPGSNGTDPFGTGIGVTGDADPWSDPIPGIAAAPPPRLPNRSPQIVPAKLFDGTRVSGDSQIRPPDEVRVALHAEGKTQLVTTVKMCLDRRGRVSRLWLIKSSEYDAYDQRILEAMRSWIYRPYLVNGEPIPVCTAITFLYRVRD